MTDSPHNHFNCSRGCSHAPLTLADRELITGRDIIVLDEETGDWFCGDCLADLPADDWEALFHVCGEEAAEAVAVVHETRTTQPAGYLYHADGSRRSTKRAGLMRDRSSLALCSCGWVAAGATREEARSRARAHREEQAALIAAGKAA